MSKIVPVFVRSPFNYDMMQVSDETGLSCQDESLTVQSEKDDADINTIVKRFGLTGELPSDIAMPQSGDFTNAMDFHQSMNVVRRAQEEFLRVPADIRARFGNDPQAFMSFMEDDRNRDEAARLGLLKAPVAVPEPMAVRVVSSDKQVGA